MRSWPASRRPRPSDPAAYHDQVDDPISVSVQGSLTDRAQWIGLARQAERDGFASLYVGDHPGIAAAPFVALAAAAGVTERIGLGTCVANVGLWEPLTLAMEVAALDVLSAGRAVLGLGAGHTPAEWTMIARSIPSASDRVARLVEVTEAVQALLAGETVSSPHIGLAGAQLTEPLPVQRPVPLLVGGNGRTLLRFAARTADIVGVTGLGKTLADGHRHEVGWGPEALEVLFDQVRSAALQAGRRPEVEALVQGVAITDDPDTAAASIAEVVPGAEPDDLLEAPFMWIGAPQDIARRLLRDRDRWGITRYVIRPDGMSGAAEVMSALASLHRE